MMAYVTINMIVMVCLRLGLTLWKYLKVEALSLNAGYKIIFDNINKPQTKSLHYVQSYAVKDRINYSSISDKPRTEYSVYDILPNQDDYTPLKTF